MLFFLLLCGAGVAYLLQKWIGVAYYLLILDAVVAVGFLLFFYDLMMQARSHLREVVIPERRGRRLVDFYNSRGGDISSLNVHQGRMTGFGLLDGESAASPPESGEGSEGAEGVTFDGIPGEDVMSLRGRMFYVINTHASIELWERSGKKFGEVAVFNKEVVTVSARPSETVTRNALWATSEAVTDEHSLELRFPEATYILLSYTSV